MGDCKANYTILLYVTLYNISYEDGKSFRA